MEEKEKQDLKKSCFLLKNDENVKSDENIIQMCELLNNKGF